MQKIVAQYQEDVVSIDQYSKSVGSIGRSFIAYDGDTSVKSDYTQSDYNSFRTTPSDIYNRTKLLKLCQLAYDKVGIVQNVLNTMSEFGSKGVKISHEVPALDRFFKKWFTKVEGVEKSERFFNSIFRLGAVVIYKSYGVLPKKVEDEFKKISASIEEDGTIDLTKYKNRYIPIKYNFLNPAMIEVVGENMGINIGNPVYVMKLHSTVVTSANNYLLNRSKNLPVNIQELIFEGLPRGLKQALVKKEPYYRLESDRLSVYNYKKDDWQSWGKPITAPILDDLHVFEKLKLADISALDGIISNVRLWTLGKLGDNPQNTFLPTKAMLAKVRDILSRNVGGGTLDMVWGPELSFTESATTAHQFLGQSKYVPTIDNIYDGLGIPASLRSGGVSSTDGNYISLKTLIERLNYVRGLLIDFWTKEIELVQKACGFSKPAVIEFDYMVFTDEAAEKKLLLDLADRDIISPETIREKFNFNNKIEESKLKRDMKKRGAKQPDKAGPYHNPQTEHEYNKLLLSGGHVAPSEVGVNLKPKKEGEKSKQELTFEHQKTLKVADDTNKTGNSGGGGRPKNVTETKKRNPKTGKEVKISAYDTLIWANASQKTIHDSFVNGLQDIFGKKNLRSLSNEEAETFERIKCNILFSLEPLQLVDETAIAKKLETYKDCNVFEDIKFLKSEMEQSFGRDLSLEEQRQIYSILYVERNNG